MSERKDRLNELAIVLEELVALKPTSKSDLDRWYLLARGLEAKLIAKGGLSPEVPHILWNFLADADIRLKDSSFGDLQYRQIRLLIRFLKRGQMPTDVELKEYC